MNEDPHNAGERHRDQDLYVRLLGLVGDENRAQYVDDAYGEAGFVKMGERPPELVWS